MGIKKKLEEKFEKEYNPRAVNASLRYSKKYNLDSGNNSTYNNEADAFKHTFASALVSIEESSTAAFGGGWYHEITNKNNNWDELRMDTNNNKVGREIANKIKNKHGEQWNKLSRQEKEDIIADEVYKNMQQGKIILDPSGRRKLKNSDEKWDKHGNLYCEEKTQNIKSAPKQSWDGNGNLTGYAADISEDEKIEQLKKENELFAPENRVFYEDELNPSLIKEDDNNYNYVDKFIEQYWKDDFKMPTENDLKSKVKSGDLIYVHNYTRADGTKVSGYYRTK